MSPKIQKNKLIIILLAALFLNPSFLLAAYNEKVSTEIIKLKIEERARYENYSYPLFDSQVSAKKNFIQNRLRLGIENDLNEDAKINAVFQDYRFVKREPVNNSAISQNNFDTYILNLETRNFLGNKNLSAIIGRQELIYGSSRLFGNNDWNDGCGWDGVKLTIHMEHGKTDVFNLTLKRSDETAMVRLIGMYYISSKFKGLELYTVKKKDGTLTAGEYKNKFSASDREINLFGLNFTKEFNKRWSFNTELAMETGRWGLDKHRADAVHFEVGYNTLSKLKYNAAMEYNYATGDSSSRNNVHGTFDNFHPSNHSKYGFMDLASWQNMNEICLKNNFSLPGSDIAVNLDFHRFILNSPRDSWFDANLNAVEGRRDIYGTIGTDIGKEIDLMLSKKLNNNIEIEIGISKFWAGKFVENTNKVISGQKRAYETKNPVWSYLQIIKRW